MKKIVILSCLCTVFLIGCSEEKKEVNFHKEISIHLEEKETIGE